MFKGDGYAYCDKNNRHFVVEFFLNSKRDLDIIKFLSSLLKKARLRPLLYKDKRFNSTRIRIRSKEFYNFILRLNRRLPNSKKFKVGFISGFIDAEGYVNPKKSFIEINNTNRKVMQLIVKYLREFKLKVNLTKRNKSAKDKLASYKLYVPVSFINLKNNSIKIRRYKHSRIAG